METIAKIQLTQNQLDTLSINTIRFLSVDAVQKANSGHPGMPMGAAPMAYVLWTKFLRHNPKNPKWFNRDQFVLSAGHGSMLLYSLLHLTGYDVSLEEIKLFRQWGSITPGHPERGVTPGVSTTTGPLGQGFANGVGMAITEAYFAARYNRPGHEIINHYIYGIVSDGDLMEGVSAEAASLAGHLKLGKIIYLYDCNHITLSASTQITFTDDHARRFEAYGWHVQSVEDGNDLDNIEEAILSAQQEQHRPSLIIVRTHLGFGSPNKQDTYEAHGSPLGEEEVRETKQRLGWPPELSFYVPEEAAENFSKAIQHGAELEEEWNRKLAAYEKEFPELSKELNSIIAGEIPKDWDSDIPAFPADPKGMATRVASSKIIDSFQSKLPGFIGGSADLNPSTQTILKNAGNFSNPKSGINDTQGTTGGGFNYAGRNIFFGVREHAMAAMLNGMATHGGGIIPFGATFLTFSDYMRPAIRLASIMEAHVIYVFTHDSIGMGEDGPTHQPIEQIMSLRAIPNLVVIRPCDANETAEAWRAAIELTDVPVALILSRQNVPTLDRTFLANASNLMYGAYILTDAIDCNPDIILIGSGSEVSLLVAAKHKLEEKNIGVRIVSMPSWELFESQTPEYKNIVFPPAVNKRLAVEAGSTIGWYKYVGDKGEVLGIDHFGASAPGPVLLREFGFTVESVYEKALAIYEK